MRGQLRRIFRIVVVALVSLLATTGVAHGQSAQDKATARDLAIQANEAYEGGDYAKAADLFERAEKLYSAPTLLVGLARASSKLGKFVEAREAYNRVIREKLPPGASDAFVRAVDDAKAELPSVEGKIGWVIINVSGADQPTVTIDELNVPVASLGVRRAVNPGDHVVRASAPGFKKAEQTFSATSGAEATVSLTLEPGEGGDTPAVGPAAGTAAGSDGGDGGESDGGGSTQTILGIAALGVGGVGLVVGAITGIVASGKHGDLETACPDNRCPATVESDLDSFRTMGTLSTVGFVVGGVFAAAGVVLLVTAPSDEGADAAAALELQVSPTSVGARLRF
jgi:hypothetical protein